MHQCVSKTRIKDSLYVIPAVIYCDGAFAPEDRRAPAYLGGDKRRQGALTPTSTAATFPIHLRPPHCVAASTTVSADFFLQRPKFNPDLIF